MRIAAALVFFVSACSKPSAEPYTLYRNSSLDPATRIHFATFDGADSSGNYNLDNCQMAARLLNANVKAMNDSQPIVVGFWCEHGRYQEGGRTPMSFDARFPTDTP